LNVPAHSSLRRHALRIFRAALRAADPRQAVRRFLARDGVTLHAGPRRFPLSRFDRIFVLGAGKASAPMAQQVEAILGPRITTGWINVKDGHSAPLRRIRVQECSHPIPDARGLEGARRMVEIAAQAGPRDLVLCLISGGASALAPLPAPPLTLAHLQRTTSLLLASGATIQEINTVRKHLSRWNGGQLARLASPATVISLILSDVVGDDPAIIGSGPTVADRSTFADAHAILQRRGILARCPKPVVDRIERGRQGLVPETPKPGDPAFARTTNLIIGGNRLSLTAAAAEARALGYRPLLLSSSITGETREAAAFHAALAREAAQTGNPVRPPACLLSGGETTVTLRGSGLGGRNQEFTLAAALALNGLENCVVLSAGTDGTDGPTDAAGAIASPLTLARASALSLDPQAMLDSNDSYHFFDPLGDLLRTGPTLTNVMDIHIFLLAR
jgi:glycerate 2-kinase